MPLLGQDALGDLNLRRRQPDLAEKGRQCLQALRVPQKDSPDGILTDEW